MRALTKKQRKEYVKGGGVDCPLCEGQVTTKGDPYGTDTDRVLQDLVCMDCDATFTETYELADIELLTVEESAE